MLLKSFPSLAKASFSLAKNRLLQSPQIRNVYHYYQQELPALQYKPLPRVGDNFILDHRNDRRVLLDDYRPKKDPSIKLRFELLDEKDIEFMTQYVTQHFIEESNIVKSLGTKGEDFIELIQPMVQKWILSETSVIFKEDNKLAGAFFGNFHEREEFEELYRGELFHDDPKFVIKPDYAEDIKNGPFKDANTNRVAVILSELEWQTGKFFPKDTKSFGVLELGATHPKYMKLHLATKSSMIVRELMKEKGVTHEGGYCVAMGTWKLAGIIGHRTIFSLPYDRFLENGKPVFTNMNDGATAANVTFMNYKKDKPKLMGKI